MCTLGYTKPNQVGMYVEGTKCVIRCLRHFRNVNVYYTFKINAQITTNIGTFDFTIQSSATGQSLLNDITKAIGVDEFWWFGILYR